MTDAIAGVARRPDERAAAARRAELADLWERHRARLLFLVRQRLGPGLRQKLDSGDILQSAFLDAVRDWPAADAEFVPWMVAVIERTIRDRARFYGRQRRAAAPCDADVERLPGGEASPSAALRATEAQAMLERALARLSARDRELVLLSRVEGRSTADIAARQRRSYQATKRALSRALARLAEGMAALGA